MTAISLSAFVVMAIVTPLTLKSTKGMLEMQRLAPKCAASAAIQDRPPKTQRGNDEALPGAQGQPNGLMSSVARTNTSVHRDVSHPL